MKRVPTILVFLGLLFSLGRFASAQVSATDNELFLCEDGKGHREYRNTGNVAGCTKVQLPRALGDNWVEVGKTDAATVYVDKNTITTKGVYRKAWLTDNYVKAQIDTYSGKNFKSSKFLEYFSCTERTRQTVQQIFYSEENGGGDVIRSWNQSPNFPSFIEIAPGTIGEAMLTSVCS